MPTVHSLISRPDGQRQVRMWVRQGSTAILQVSSRHCSERMYQEKQPRGQRAEFCNKPTLRAPSCRANCLSEFVLVTSTTDLAEVKRLGSLSAFPRLLPQQKENEISCKTTVPAILNKCLGPPPARRAKNQQTNVISGQLALVAVISLLYCIPC